MKHEDGKFIPFIGIVTNQKRFNEVCASYLLKHTGYKAGEMHIKCVAECTRRFKNPNLNGFLNSYRESKTQQLFCGRHNLSLGNMATLVLAMKYLILQEDEEEYLLHCEKEEPKEKGETIGLPTEYCVGLVTPIIFNNFKDYPTTQNELEFALANGISPKYKMQGGENEQD